MTQTPITKTIIWTGQRWVDQETGVYASNLAPPPDMPQAATMPPEETARHYHEQNNHLQQQLEAAQAINEDMGRRISDYIATIRVLTELAGHRWL